MLTKRIGTHGPTVMEWLLIVVLVIVVGLCVVKWGDAAPKVEETDDRATVLGRQLFFDPLLSSNRKVSCATCHLPDNQFASKGLPPDMLGGVRPRRAPSLLGSGDRKLLFWDGRANSLEKQAKEVINDKHEMGGTLEETFQRVKKRYPELTSIDDMVACIAAFERTLKATPNKLDLFLSGKNKSILSESELRGWAFFRGEGQCYKCHSGPDYTDDMLHNVGLAHRIKTPSLRGCGSVGPLGSDGRFRALNDVIEHYRQGGGELKPLSIDERTKNDLVNLLKGL